MKACGRGGWALFMFSRIELATAPRADEIAQAVIRAQTLPSIPYWLCATPRQTYVTRHVSRSTLVRVMNVLPVTASISARCRDP